MPARKPEELLGGYATGTLTEEERRALFEAALHDQALFEALADEQALKELLEDPAVRRRLAAALEEASRRAPAARGWALPAWLTRPATLKLTGTVAAALLLVVLVIGVYREGGLPVPGERLERAPIDAASEQAVAESEDERGPTAPPAGLKDEGASSSVPAPPPSSPSRALPRRTEPPAARVTPPEEAPPSERDAFQATRRPLPAEEQQKRTERPAAPLAGAWRVTALFGGLAEGRAAVPSRAPAEPTPEPGRASREQVRPEALSKSAPRPEARFGMRERMAEPPGGGLALRYRIVERGPDGADRIVGSGGRLEGLGTVELAVGVDQPGYLYIVAETGSGRRVLVYPGTAGPPATAGAGEQAGVRSGEIARVPLGAVLASAREEGPVRVVILLARRPLEERGTKVTEAVVAAARRAGDASTLRIASGGPEPDATSVVNPSEDPDAVVAVRLTFAPTS